MSISNVSKSSKAGTSRKSLSSQSSISSARLKAATALARLQAEAANMSAIRAIEEEEFRLKQRKRDCKLKLDIAMATAEEKALEDIEEKSVNDDFPELSLKGSTTEDKVGKWLIGSSQPAPPSMPKPMTDVGLQREMIDTMLLPKCELVKFNGDPLDYWVFISSFDGAVGSTSVGASAKLNRLFQYCEGDALKVIRCCAVMQPEEGYAKARELLRERFGNDYRISETWVRKLTEGPRVMPGERKGIQSLADDLMSCTLALTAMNKLDEIDTKRSLGLIVKRLPQYLQSKWRSKAVGILEKTGRYPNIERLVEFLNKAAREANDPVYGLEERNSKDKCTVKRGSNFNIQGTSTFDEGAGGGTKASKQQGNKNWKTKSSKPAACPLCSGEHLLLACSKFRQMSPSERLTVARDNKLCFKCLSGDRHFSRMCKQAPCGVQGCKGSHSKMLHDVFKMARPTYNDDAPRQRESPEVQQVGATSLACGSQQKHAKIALPVVSVMVKGTGGEEWLKTNALLDPGSNRSFCSMELIKMLSVQGTPQSMCLDTLNKASEVQTLVVSLDISGIIGGTRAKRSFCLPRIHALREFPTLRDSCATYEDLKKFKHLKDIPFPHVPKGGVTMLIGQDAPHVLAPLEVRHGMEGEPYAVRTCLGWTVNGPLASGTLEMVVSNFVQGSLEAQVERFWKLDGVDSSDDRTMSIDDKRAVRTWNDSIILVDGHYQLDIPFKSNHPNLPENMIMAERRLQSLAKRLTKDPGLYTRYCAEIQNLLSRGYAERVPKQELEASPRQTWYLPHHCVLNPNKPEKLRVVFDCAARCGGTSLNDSVLQGPDMMNKLVGVLTRFREHKVGLMADIEQMFHQVGVSKGHRDVLRFLWWPEGDIKQPPAVFRMTVHLFGGVWSPSCAAFALRRTADDNEAKFNPDTVLAVKENFYVDDLLKSFKSEDEAALMVKQLTDLLAKGGFRLTKWISSSRKVLESIPTVERAKTVTDLDLDLERLPVERALGVHWDTEGDQIGVKIKVKSKCHTKRGLLSIISSVYDPLGFVCPFVLRAKILFQNECRIVGKGWDEPLEVSTQDKWVRWLDDLSGLDKFRVERCLIPDDFGDVSECRLHHFSDASQDAYGTVSYVRFVNAEGAVHCSFLIGKSRLAPLKTMTIPRLELSAAVIAVRMDQMLKRELRLEIQGSTFWTDSMLVLQYINNQTKRFQTFVANRVATIHDGSTASQWRYVNTEQNPADDSSRGLDAQSMLYKERWRKGPEFLWQSEYNWPVTPKVPSLQEKDKEVKKEAVSRVVNAADQDNPIERLINRYSSIHRLRKAVAWLLRFGKWLLHRRPKNLNAEDTRSQRLTVAELQDAELAIIRIVQRRHYKEEFRDLEAGKTSIKSQSAIYCLEPYLDGSGILRLGGRLRHAPVEDTRKYPAILPRDSHLATLIVRHAHESLSGHSGKEYVLSVIRRQYWIPKVRPLINRILKGCVLCRRLRGLPGEQRMADLPVSRVTPGKPPFTYVGVDCFGPFYVKRGRSREKRYGCLFTCLSIRAIHLEKLNTLESDSFLNAFIRFAARRGTPEKVRSDNGTNFIGGERELRLAIKRLEENKQTEGFFLNRRIKWEFNPPAASHMGGVWERQIRTCRKILNALMRDQVLDDEKLDTLFCEVESIVNDRPITAVSDDPKDLEALTPNHLLKLGHGHPVPLRDMKQTDKYGKRWKHVQLLVELFWKRWISEYLPTLQCRQRWIKSLPNFQIGDIVLIRDDNSPRNQWPLARITKTFPGGDTLVRSVEVRTAAGSLVRPITKLCLLEGVLG